jgi:hypothetical protein
MDKDTMEMVDIRHVIDESELDGLPLMIDLPDD